MSVLSLLAALAMIPLAFWLALLGALALISLYARRRLVLPRPGATARLAVLIPAHDEELLIASTVKAILATAYPQELRTVVVVADNCSDRTAELARQAGAICLERHDTQRRGKAFALEFGLAALPDLGDFDAVVLFDADSKPEPDFLARMAAWVADGREVIQGRYDVLEPERTWFTRLTSIAMTLKNLWQYPGLDRLGQSVPLRGTGMCLSRRIVERHGWPGRSLTEDLDATIAFLSAGIRITYDPGAVTLQYMPPDMASALVQRRRWSAGENEARAPLTRLIRDRMRCRDILGALHGLYLAMPPFSMHFAACIGLAGVALLPVLAGEPGAVFRAALALSAAHAAYFLLGLSELGLRRENLAALGMIPVYAAWRTWVHVAASIGRVTNWDRTPRV
uniref:Glycosyltransferase n=1 Tax=Fundidesulfovibrio putealis TaxID=270496 RepID=A0A7C4AIC5_9BACT